ncbi:hypothetical protein GQ53DRAFT_112713 [Thozetella sp. PMI_491]|nr:hypothetical protein GQ53DRAFT_112713 [Thozetella sp. PMI_491]
MQPRWRSIVASAARLLLAWLGPEISSTLECRPGPLRNDRAHGVPGNTADGLEILTQRSQLKTPRASWGVWVTGESETFHSKQANSCVNRHVGTDNNKSQRSDPVSRDPIMMSVDPKHLHRMNPPARTQPRAYEMRTKSNRTTARSQCRSQHQSQSMLF